MSTGDDDYSTRPAPDAVAGRPDPVRHWVKMIGLTFLMSPVALAGIVLCLSIWLIPVGLVLLVLAAWPVYSCDQRHEAALSAAPPRWS